MWVNSESLEGCLVGIQTDPSSICPKVHGDDPKESAWNFLGHISPVAPISVCSVCVLCIMYIVCDVCRVCVSVCLCVVCGSSGFSVFVCVCLCGCVYVGVCGFLCVVGREWHCAWHIMVA